MTYRANKSICHKAGLESVLLSAIAKQLRDTERRVVVAIRYANWFARPLSRSRTACLSRALARLEARGLVVRLPGRRVRLTNAGRARLRAELGVFWLPSACLTKHRVPCQAQRWRRARRSGAKRGGS
jgi:hypothetical protein